MKRFNDDLKEGRGDGAAIFGRDTRALTTFVKGKGEKLPIEHENCHTGK